MNLDDLLQEAATQLRSEYGSYDVAGAAQALEDRIITAEAKEVAHPHPSGTPEATESQPEHTDSGVEDWREKGACRDHNVEQIFTRGAEQRKARMVCFGCPVRFDCLVEALNNKIEFGVWGGMTERERRALLRRRPDIRDWRDFLGRASTEDSSAPEYEDFQDSVRRPPWAFVSYPTVASHEDRPHGGE